MLGAEQRGAGRRMNAVSADQKFNLAFRSIGKTDPGMSGVRFDGLDPMAELDDRFGELPPQGIEQVGAMTGELWCAVFPDGFVRHFKPGCFLARVPHAAD